MAFLPAGVCISSPVSGLGKERTRDCVGRGYLSGWCTTINKDCKGLLQIFPWIARALQLAEEHLGVQAITKKLYTCYWRCRVEKIRKSGNNRSKRY